MSRVTRMKLWSKIALVVLTVWLIAAFVFFFYSTEVMLLNQFVFFLFLCNVLIELAGRLLPLSRFKVFVISH